MLAWLGGSKRRRWHSNQSKKKGVKNNSTINGSRWPVDDAAGVRGNNETAVELSNMERWANPLALDSTTFKYGRELIPPNALQIPSLDMFALAGPGSAAAGLSRTCHPQPRREPPAGPAPPKQASRYTYDKYTAATVPAKRRKEDPVAGTFHAACGPEHGGRPVGRAAAESSGGQIYDAECPDETSDDEVADRDLSAVGARISSSAGGGPALTYGRGRGRDADAVGGMTSDGGAGSAVDPDGVASAAAETVATRAAAASAARWGSAAGQVRRGAAAQHPLPSGVGGQQPAADRAATRRGAMPVVSLDILWLESTPK